MYWALCAWYAFGGTGGMEHQLFTIGAIMLGVVLTWDHHQRGKALAATDD